MRLTLRTMLAYLDDILEPDDSQDIAKKIEESEFATELVHRTRDCMRRLRLGVPPITGKGLATDPNTVAEYLDNTLTTDRVPEFEKICLESDVHLAEVAACHQILTLVLGEPATIDPESRQRMYRVATEVDAPPVQTDAIKPAAAAVTPPAPPRRPKPEVPEYLREPRSRVWPVVAAMLFGALLTVGALALFGPADWRNQVVALTQGDEENAAEPADAGNPPQPASQPPEQAEPTAATPLDDATATPAAPEAADAPPSTELDMPAEPAGDPIDAPTAPLPSDVDDVPAGTRPVPPAGDEPDAPAGPSDDAAATPAVRQPADTLRPVPTTPVPEAPGDVEPIPGEGPDEAMPDETPGPREAGPPAAEPREAGADAGFGRYTSKREVLLRFDNDAGVWKRLPVMAPLAKGDRLLSLPLFRPSIALSTSVTIQPDGAALLELVGWTDQGVPIVAVEYGRLLMMTVGKAGNSIELKLGDEQPQITFVDAEGTLALEARRKLPAGADPTAGPAPMSVDLYATSGTIRVRQGDGPPVDLAAPMRRVLFGDAVEPAGADFPKWVTSEALNDFDRRATTTLEPLLPEGETLSLILKELSADRRREVRSLAIRGATHLGIFEPCTAALNEKDEKPLWPAYIDELRDSIARSPETALQVREAFRKRADGDALFRMLWGYSPDDLNAGAAASLVDGLNHDSLDYRVLAFWNLQDITGLPTYGYYPADVARKRATAVKSWRDRLRAGKIVPRSVAAATRAKAAPPAEAESP